MHMFFSGVSDAEVYALLLSAGVPDILVDPHDLKNVSLDRNGLALDCGAYRAWKAKTEIDPHKYLKLVQSHAWNFAAAGEVMFDPYKSMAWWVDIFSRESSCIPVWQWGSDQQILHYYLDSSELVGIGGLVPKLRSRRDEKMSPEARKDWNKKRMATVKELVALCSIYPKRFHLFGLCYVNAIEALRNLAYSCDTSLWLDGRRYRNAIFVNTQTGHLSNSPARFIPAYKGKTTLELCVMNAETLHEYCQH